MRGSGNASRGALGSYQRCLPKELHAHIAAILPRLLFPFGLAHTAGGVTTAGADGDTLPRGAAPGARGEPARCGHAVQRRGVRRRDAPGGHPRRGPRRPRDASRPRGGARWHGGGCQVDAPPIRGGPLGHGGGGGGGGGGRRAGRPGGGTTAPHAWVGRRRAAVRPPLLRWPAQARAWPPPPTGERRQLTGTCATTGDSCLSSRRGAAASDGGSGGLRARLRCCCFSAEETGGSIHDGS